VKNLLRFVVSRVDTVFFFLSIVSMIVTIYSIARIALRRQAIVLVVYPSKNENTVFSILSIHSMNMKHLQYSSSIICVQQGSGESFFLHSIPPMLIMKVLHIRIFHKRNKSSLIGDMPGMNDQNRNISYLTRFFPSPNIRRVLSDMKKHKKILIPS